MAAGRVGIVRNMRRHFVLAACLAGLACVAGCATHARLACDAESRAMVEERLYFGTQRPDGGAPVSDAEWAAFVADTVAPAFPDGFTTWDAQGGWRGADGRAIREASHVLSVVHPGREGDDAGAGGTAIAAVAAAYKARFAQEAVMRVRAPACVEF
jgi:hypothetical protein